MKRGCVLWFLIIFFVKSTPVGAGSLDDFEKDLTKATPAKKKSATTLEKDEEDPCRSDECDESFAAMWWDFFSGMIVEGGKASARSIGAAAVDPLALGTDSPRAPGSPRTPFIRVDTSFMLYLGTFSI